MAFNRALAPAEYPPHGQLTPALIGIGMNFSGTAARNPNIEDTLLRASEEGMERDDLRVLSVLVTWFGIHYPWVNADRLTRIVAGSSSERIRAFWSAMAKWKSSDHRYGRLCKGYSGPPVDLLSPGSGFHIRRHGEDPRFENGPLRVAANTLRDREADILAPAELAKRHSAYRWRIIIGPTYRADMWAALDDEPELTAAELARRAYGSFATAWHVKRDFGISGKSRRSRTA